MSTTLVCVGCQATATHTVVGGALGPIMHATGFTPVLSHDDRVSVLWTCPACYDRAHALAQQLVQLLGGNEHIHFYGLLKPCGEHHNWGRWEPTPAPFGEIARDAQGRCWFYQRSCQTLGCSARQYAQTLAPVGETRIDEIRDAEVRP